MNKQQFNEGQRFMIVAIRGQQNFQNYLLANGFAIGTTVFCNYSPNYCQLVNFSIKGKMLSLRKKDVENIEFVEI